MKKIFVFALALCFSVFSFGQSIDTEKSVVKFSVSNMKINTVEGTLKGMKGEVDFDANEIENSSFSTSVDISTIDTGIKSRDKHLKKEDFFNAETYPTLSFTSSNVSKTDSGYMLKGNLTIKNVTKAVTIPFTVSDVDGQVQLKGNFVISRLEYNVGADTGTFTVGDEVSVTVICVLKPE